MGKSTISMAIFHSFLLVHQAGYFERFFLDLAGFFWALLVFQTSGGGTALLVAGVSIRFFFGNPRTFFRFTHEKYG